MLSFLLALCAALFLAVLTGPLVDRHCRLALLLAVFSILLAGGLYAALGSPDIPGQPFVSREKDGGYLSQLRRMAARQPQNPALLYHLGEAAAESGQTQEAAEAWGKLLLMIPQEDPRHAILMRRIKALQRKPR